MGTGGRADCFCLDGDGSGHIGPQRPLLGGGRLPVHPLVRGSRGTVACRGAAAVECMGGRRRTVIGQLPGCGVLPSHMVDDRPAVGTHTWLADRGTSGIDRRGDVRVGARAA